MLLNYQRTTENYWTIGSIKLMRCSGKKYRHGIKEMDSGKIEDSTKTKIERVIRIENLIVTNTI